MSIEEQLKKLADEINTTYKPSPLTRYLDLCLDDRPQDKEVHVYRYDCDEIYLLPMADLHLGIRYLDRELLDRFLQFILDTDNCYTVLLGDQIENATKASVGAGFFEEDIHLEQQMDMLCDLLSPLATSGKIWGLHEGNHEFRTTALTGLKPMRIVSQRLGVPYLGYQSYHMVDVRDQRYDIFTTHGRGAGRTVTGKIKAAQDMEKIAVCDVYITGHTHIKHVDPPRPIMYIEDGRLKQRLRRHVICGSFMQYWGGYSEKDCFEPAVQGSPLIILSGTRHDVRIIS